MYTDLDSMIIWTQYEELKKKREREKEESAENANCITTWKNKLAFLGECIVSRTQVSWPVNFLKTLVFSTERIAMEYILPWVSNCKLYSGVHILSGWSLKKNAVDFSSLY